MSDYDRFLDFAENLDEEQWEFSTYNNYPANKDLAGSDIFSMIEIKKKIIPVDIKGAPYMVIHARFEFRNGELDYIWRPDSTVAQIIAGE